MAREQTAPAEPARLDGIAMSEDELAAELARRLDILRRDRKSGSRPTAVPQQPPQSVAEQPVAEAPVAGLSAIESPPRAEPPPPIDDVGEISNDALADEISRRLESWKETRGKAKPAAAFHPPDRAVSRPPPRSAEIQHASSMRLERTPPAARKSAPPNPIASIAPVEVPAAKRIDWTVMVPPDHYARDYYGQQARDARAQARRHRMPLLAIILLAGAGVLMPASWNPMTLYRALIRPPQTERPATEAELGSAPAPAQTPASAPAPAPENQVVTAPTPSSPQTIAPVNPPPASLPLAHEEKSEPVASETPPPVTTVTVPEKIPQAVKTTQAVKTPEAAPKDKKASPTKKAAAAETPSPSAMKAKPFEPAANMPTPTVTPAPDNAWLKVKPFEPSSQ